MTGDRMQHNLEDALPSGRARLIPLAVQGRQRLARPLQAHLARPPPLTQGGVGAGRLEQGVDQPMAPALLLHQRQRLTA